ncbi:hypothetical protein PCASD_26540 [Puccinia coronata f. sp. avenae]|uniref:Uncharacterized protein n=1 Tax=Puccinia coronata f. sp. avenae TaxID=200324 RepID=A0A2N5RTX3_9BASI|nr:hypothetical protein PCASD_26540 [Puccinia coronata f. sp. avenae]
MGKWLYIKIGQMIAGEKVPSVSYEHLTGYHGPRGLYDPDSWVGEKKASSVVSARDLATVPNDTVIKLMEMLSSIVSGCDAQTRFFEEKLQRDEEFFRGQLLEELLEMLKDRVFDDTPAKNP